MRTIPMGQFVQIECIMVGTRLPGVSGIMENAWHCYCECLKVLGKASLQRNLYSVFTLLLDPACLWLCPTKSCSRTSLILKSCCVVAGYFPIVITISTLIHPNLLDNHEPPFPWSNTIDSFQPSFKFPPTQLSRDFFLSETWLDTILNRPVTPF